MPHRPHPRRHRATAVVFALALGLASLVYAVAPSNPGSAVAAPCPPPENTAGPGDRGAGGPNC